MAKEPKLTIGMATHDDIHGVYMTITSLIAHHGEVIRDCEIVVVNNNPDSERGALIQKWVENRTPARHVIYTERKGTAGPRQEVVEQAQAPAVLCLDCHVMLYPGVVKRLIEHYQENPETLDLLQGPLITDSGTAIMGTHQRPEWGGGALGKWSVDDRGRDPNGEPFEIWQQGLGLFSCRTDAWVDFHPRFRGFGGCETYIAEKFRRQGGRVMCAPWLRWTHRFLNPDRTDEVSDFHKCRNYLIGFQELGIDTQQVLDHFHITQEEADRIVSDDLIPQAQPEAPKIVDTGFQMSGKLIQLTPARSKRVAVVGCQKWGPMKMRGIPLAQEFGFAIEKEDSIQRSYDTIVAVKEVHPRTRRYCETLIIDPCDVFFSDHRRFKRPAEYFTRVHKQIQYDIAIGTSPSYCTVLMEAAPSTGVCLVPHPCDPRLVPSYDPDGPIVYAGQGCFIESRLDDIKTACAAIGRKFRAGLSQNLLTGASLALCLRLPPYDSQLNRHCKPQVKVENAAAVGLPVLSTDDPAALSLRPNLVTISPRFTVDELVKKLLEALNSEPLHDPYSQDQYLDEMDRIIYR